ncbi:GspH/FimT family pseudopilin [Halomonas daqiaonensis]|uniref:Type II secretion system protein H n=1 Tax=Halomonas daqiaonensis TaxID=650850 RepID=A0A1H7WIR4_9GAMM|nr:GspH/FimT family pseudopilin [Halomonas daqiaonensis]SEM20888.1 type IV fimbrial biogenesis protein FimT [Halomonas daqiaonensis]
MHPAVSSPLSARQYGLTLIELIVAIAVLAIMATVGIPGFQQFTARNEVAAEVMRIKTALALARNTAVTRRRTISVCPRPTPDSLVCNFTDWTHSLVVVDGQVASGDLTDGTLLKVLEGSGGPTVTFNRSYPVRYQALGWAREHNGTFEICGRDGKGVKVIVSNMGRVRIGGEADGAPAC